MTDKTTELRKRLLEPPQYTVLGDQAIAAERLEDDHFELSRRIGAIYDILRHPDTETPMTIGIFGDWGSGKTSAMKWLEGRLEEWNKKGGDKKGNITVRTAWFYPWKYDSKEDVWRGLIAEAVIACLKAEENSFEGFVSAVKDLGGFLGGSFVDLVSSVKLGVGPVGEIDLKSLKDIKARAEDYVSPQNAYLHEFETALQNWITKTLGKRERMVIFIDDLDRCLPQITLQVLEALKLYLNIPKLIFVVGVDNNVVNDLVQKHYKDHGLSEEKSRDYLAKMFQVEVTLAPSDVEIDAFLDSLLARSSAWKEIKDETARKVFRKTIRSLGGRSPREIKRLMNSSLLALAGARLAAIPAEAAEKPPTAVEQMQVLFVRRVLEKPRLNRASLVGDNWGTRFFTAWSEAVRNGAPKTIQVDPKITELVERASDRAGTKSEAAPELEKLLADVPEAFHGILQERTFAPLFGLFTDQDLGELMRLPYPEEAAAIGKSLGHGAETDLIREAVARSLGIRLEQLRDEDFPKVTKLELKGSDISNLQPFQALANLQELHLGGTQVVELEPLRVLTNLQELNLDGTQVADLEPLRVLTNLQELNLDNTQVADLEPLRVLINLQELNINHTQVADLEPLRVLINLQELNFNHTQVADLEPLTVLINLRNLELADTQVADLEPLTQLPNLEWLDVSGTQVADLVPLRTLTNLKVVFLNRIKITDLGPLRTLTNLNSLYLSSTKVTDLAPLKALTNLKALSLRDTNVTDLEPLKALANLQRLAVSDTQVADLGPLKDLSKLERLELDHTQIADLGPLKDLSKLERLELGYTQIAELQPLTVLTNLQELSLDSTQVADLQPLTVLTNLQVLDLDNTQVADLEPVKGLSRLTRVSLRNTKVSAAAISDLKAARPKLTIQSD